MTQTAPALKKKFSIEEYLLFEEQAEQKHEYLNGNVLPMSGETIEHNQISGNLLRIIGNELIAVGKMCQVLSSDMKIWIEMAQRFVYPDVTVICNEPQLYKDRRDAINNPLLLVEVLSESTEAYDRGKKFERYSLLPSLREYVLVSQYEPVVEVFFRDHTRPADWQYHRETGLEAQVQFHSIDCKFTLKEIYHLVQFPPHKDSKEKKTG
jgi:Uma2 family endonuclease